MRTQGSSSRVHFYSIVWGVFCFVTLAAAVVAGQAVQASSPENTQPFTAWLPSSLPVAFVVLALVSLVLAVAFYQFIGNYGTICAWFSKDVKKQYRVSLEFRPASIAQAACILFACWLPIIILMYPTGFTADTFNQLYQYQTQAPTLYMTTGEVLDGEFIDHHPIFDTLLYGWFWRIGAALGNQNLGLFLLTLLQSIVLAAELAAMVCYMGHLGSPRRVRFLALFFLAFFPMVPHYAATVLKDVTYLTVFIPWLLIWLEAFSTKGDALRKPGMLVAFFLLGGFCVLTKKIGVYVLVACLAVAVLALREQRMRLVAGGIATLLVFGLAFPALVYPVIGGVAPGGQQEALAVPIQQTVALYKNNPQAYTSEETAMLSKVLNLDQAQKNYEAFRADGAKSAWQGGATVADVRNFVGLWLRKGIQHPVSYTETLVYTTGMLYIPYLKMTYYTSEDFSGRAARYEKMNTGFNVEIQQPEAFIELNNYLEYESPESKISDLPIISLFFTQGFYGSWLPIFATLLILCAGRATRLRYSLGAMAPVFFTIGTFFVCPVASPRYVLPLLFTAPAYLAWATGVLSGTIMHAGKHERATETEQCA